MMMVSSGERPVRWWSCFFGHRWTLWEEVTVTVNLERDPSLFLVAHSPKAWKSMTTAPALRLRRHCTTCGLAQMERL